ncbi:probable transcription factor At5g61620 [Zingiber officinale]|uniref:probable transcription factor At5g61620 n=1 Tax=Zingiber officinale TaxID=94328 RepID=UPI001C4C70ED|nr:probable transcription factor At5g61620 [Zingiber officinale]
MEKDTGVGLQIHAVCDFKCVSSTTGACRSMFADGRGDEGDGRDGSGNGSRTPAEKKLFDDWLAGKLSGLIALDSERKQGVPWTQEEHRLFLLGLKKYGKGNWSNISRNFVINRTAASRRITPCPSHACSDAVIYFPCNDFESGTARVLGASVSSFYHSNHQDCYTSGQPRAKVLHQAQI